MSVGWPLIRALMEIRDLLDRCCLESPSPGGEPRAAGITGGGDWPPADVYEEGDRLVVVTEVPGASADSVELGLVGGRLRLTAQLPPSERVRAAGRLLRMERATGGFTRDLRLPTGTVDTPEWSLDRGVLTVRMRLVRPQERRGRAEEDV